MALVHHWYTSLNDGWGCACLTPIDPQPLAQHLTNGGRWEWWWGAVDNCHLPLNTMNILQFLDFSIVDITCRKTKAYLLSQSFS